MQGLFSSESRWTHTLSLLHVLNNLLTVSSDRFPISSIASATRLVVEEDFGDLSSPVQALAQGVLGSTWNIKELTDILAEVSKRLQSQEVQDKELVETAWEMVLEKGMKSASDLVVIGFSMAEVCLDMRVSRVFRRADVVSSSAHFSDLGQRRILASWLACLPCSSRVNRPRSWSCPSWAGSSPT